MNISITTVTVNQKENTIQITGTDLERIFLKDLYEAIDEMPEVTYEFHLDMPGNRNYLFKLVSSVKQCKEARSMGEKIEKLTGAILYINDAFRI